jgi:NAD(P)-dependent dehydrogenase (short-subunit alcohol dehydrogenase family)
MKCSLEGQVALVTGAGRGIGKAIALGLARAGADVVLASRKLPNLEATAEEIRKLGRKALPIATHVGKLEEIKALVDKAVAEFGKIDILVNNSATNVTMAPVIDVDDKAWDSIMNLNVKGLFFLAQTVAKVMKEKGGGKIINVSSVAGQHPDILAIYSISKAAVNMATKVMAQQWAPLNIRVNAIAPSMTRTEFSKALWGNPDIEKAITSRTPMGRIAEPEEMVGAVVFLASDASSYVTGQIIAVDGGITI